MTLKVVGFRQFYFYNNAKKSSALSVLSFSNVGMTGFEPATLWSQTRCATGLRYIPILDAVRARFELAVQFPVRQFSKLVV